MTKLSVNLNKVALVRNSRSLGIPSVTHLGAIALAAGADGLTVHPRPDERHIRAQDALDIAKLLESHPGCEFNIEGNPFQNMLDLVARCRPDQCTLVPDDPSAVTSDHGWDLARDAARLEPHVRTLRDWGVRVSLFMDPAPGAMTLARDLGAQRVELYTEPYARTFGHPDGQRVLAQYAEAARAAQAAGLGVNAGHDLNRANLPAFLATVPDVLEVSIGHALTADALEMGMGAAVRAYLHAMGRDA